MADTPHDPPGAAVWQSGTLAQHYLTGVRGAIPLAATQLDVMARLLAALGRPVARFLDLGCGDGILAATVLAQHPAATGILLDFSPPMLDAARARLAAHTGPLRFIAADYGDPRWVEHVRPHAPLDAVVSGFSIHHQPDARKRDIYAEIYALLRPGGLFVNVEHVASPSRWLAAVHDDLFVDSLTAYHRQQGGTQIRQQVADTYYYRPDKAANILAPVEAQCDWLRAIGFADVDCYCKVFELAVFGGRRPA